MAIECSCNGICSRHLEQALENNAGLEVSARDLYDESRALKKADPSAPRAAHDNDIERCGKCKKTFQYAAVEHNKSAGGVVRIAQSLGTWIPASKIPV
jgi:hypothetical protein